MVLAFLLIVCGSKGREGARCKQMGGFWSVNDIAVIEKMENIGSLKKLKEIMDLCLDMIRKLADNCIGVLRFPCLS